MFTHTKRWFQLLLTTILTTLLSLITVEVSTAADFNEDQLQGKLIIKETCGAGAPGKPAVSVRKIKSTFTMTIDPHDNNLKGKDGTSASPFAIWEFVSITIDNFDGVNPETFLSGPGSDPNNGNRGIALTKNFIKGEFHTSTFNVNTGGNRLLALSGVIVAEKDGDAKKISGKIAGRDWGNRCIYTGKFKGKQCPNNLCL